MPDISIPYGTGHVNCSIPDNRFAGVLQAKPQPSMTLHTMVYDLLLGIPH